MRLGYDRCYPTQQLWQNCDELNSCFSLGYLLVGVFMFPEEEHSGDTHGRLGWIGETCIFGDFSIYEKYEQMVKQKRKEIEENTSNDTFTFGYAYRGVASAMVMHKRYELLYNYSHDPLWFA